MPAHPRDEGAVGSLLKRCWQQPGVRLWIESEGGFQAPDSIMDSCLSVTRSESGSLPVDVLPATVRACAVTAAIHAETQAQAAGRVVEEQIPDGMDYRPKKENKPLKGEGAWWGYGLGLR